MIANVNLRRGLTRIYLVLTCVWILGVLVYPFAERKWAFDNWLEARNACYARDRSFAGFMECKNQYDVISKVRFGPNYSKSSYEMAYGPPSWERTEGIAGLCILPPVLAYGLVLVMITGGYKLFVWVRKGFVADPETGAGIE